MIADKIDALDDKVSFNLIESLVRSSIAGMKPLIKLFLKTTKMSKTKLSFVSKNVVSGDYIFHLIDSVGMPFPIVQECLSEYGWAFDVWGFMLACAASPNMSSKKTRRLLIDHAPDEASRRMIASLFDQFWDN